MREFRGHGVGTNLLNMVKRLFVTENRTGCRFITVDAYNDPEVLTFYQKNDFDFFYDKDSRNLTRAMWYDLKRLQLTGEFA